MRVQIEKTIGVIDQQLIKTDAKLYKLMGPAKKPAAKIKAKAKAMPKMAKKVKAKAKKKKK